MKESNHLPEKIKTLRKKKDWTQQELAQNTGLYFNVITKIEQGVIQYPNLKTLLKIADAFGISLDDLIGRKINNK